MSHLRELQQTFADYLISPANDAPIQQAIVSDDNGDAALRLNLYGNAYVIRLSEALDTDFSGVHALLGDDEFMTMCQRYIAAYPSQHPSIRWFGGKLYDFLRDTAPYSEHEILLEMAEFEWAKSTVFDALDTTAVTLDQLVAIDPQRWGDMHFEFIPALRCLTAHNNVSLLWDAIKQEVDELPDLQRTDIPVVWIVWRKNNDPHWRSLDVDEAFALDYCQQGMCFADLCEHLCEWVDEQHAPLRAATFLKSWVNGGMVSKINITN